MFLFAVAEAIHVFLQVSRCQKDASAMRALVEMVVISLFCHVSFSSLVSRLMYVQVYFFVV